MAEKSGLRKRLCGKTGIVLWMLSLTSIMFLVEVVVGYVTNSMALVAESYHMLSDIMSLILDFVALRYSKRSQRTDRNTFGWQRAEVLAALVNSVFLIALCFTILVESLKRLIETESIHNPDFVLIVAGVGLFISVVGLAMFNYGRSHGGGGHGHGHSHTPALNDRLVVVEESEEETDGKDNDDAKDVDNAESINSAFLAKENSSIQNNGLTDNNIQVHNRSEHKVKSSAQLNMRAVYLLILNDALDPVMVIVSALIIKYATGEWTLYVDPVTSILIASLTLRNSLTLMKESSMILLQTVPTHINIEEVQERLLEGVHGILSVHEFHVWQLTDDKIIATAHITCQTPDDYMKIASQIKEFFHNEGIHSTTIQPEFVEELHTVKKDKECALACGEMENCAAQKCCPDETVMRKRVPTVVSSGSASPVFD